MEYEMQHGDIAPETKVSKLENRIEELEAKNERLRKENGRFREALASILTGFTHTGGNPQDVAREALYGGGDTDA